MNWGKIIVITLAIFGVFIAGMSVYMLASPQDEYDHDYYEKGLNFDHDYAKEENVVKDNAQPQIQIGTDNVLISFNTSAAGTIKFERPSGTQMDQTFQVAASRVIIPLRKLQQGEWQLVFDWKSNGRSYLYQHKIMVP